MRNNLGKEIAIECTDGNVYRGRLERYDTEAISLLETMQFILSEMRWADPILSPRGDTADIGSQIDAFGQVDTKKIRVSLKSVFIRIETISRIWPWIPPDQSAGQAGYMLV